MAVSKRILPIFLILLIIINLSVSAHAKAPNEIFTNKVNKIIYDSCKNSIDNNISEEEFQKTACYAHIAGSLNMIIAFGLNLAVGKDTDSMKKIETDIKRIFCDFNGYSIRDLAQKYILMHNELNQYEIETQHYRYGSFATLVQEKQLCKKYFIKDKK